MQQLICLFAAPLMLTGSVLADDSTDILARAHAAYAAMGPLVVTEEVSSTASDGQRSTWKVTTTIDGLSQMHTQMGTLSISGIDSTLYIVDQEADDLFAIIEAHGKDFARAATDAIPTFVPTPAMSIISSEDVDAWINSLSVGRIEDPTMTSLGRSTVETSVVDQVAISGTGGRVVVSFDAETHLLSHMEGALQEGDTSSSFSIKWSQHARSDMAPLSFDQSGRTAVASYDRLFQYPGGIGSPVRPGIAPPDFTLPVLGGGSVTLSKLKGEWVVLNFWATWCKPSTRDLDQFEALATWSQEQDLDVEVLTVNIWEGGKDAVDRREKAATWWIGHDMTLPVLMSHAPRDDPNGLSSRWKVSGIPLTVVIDPEGRVALAQSGVSGCLLDEIKALMAPI